MKIKNVLFPVCICIGHDWRWENIIAGTSYTGAPITETDPMKFAPDEIMEFGGIEIG